MDAAGVGKIITISQALFEGITPRNWSSCLKEFGLGPYPGGCLCKEDKDCISCESVVRNIVLSVLFTFSFSESISQTISGKRLLFFSSVHLLNCNKKYCVAAQPTSPWERLMVFLVACTSDAISLLSLLLFQLLRSELLFTVHNYYLIG